MHGLVPLETGTPAQQGPHASSRTSGESRADPGSIAEAAPWIAALACDSAGMTRGTSVAWGCSPATAKPRHSALRPLPSAPVHGVVSPDSLPSPCAWARFAEKAFARTGRLSSSRTSSESRADPGSIAEATPWIAALACGSAGMTRGPAAHGLVSSDSGQPRGPSSRVHGLVSPECAKSLTPPRSMGSFRRISPNRLRLPRFMGLNARKKEMTRMQHSKLIPHPRSLQSDP